ncbi:MAG: endonuclease MutS2 [Anaerolineales bacterium]|nr:endonuclease MutS2 [Anaerolineales bacterium]
MNQKALKTLEYAKILHRLADYCDYNPAREQAVELHPQTDLETVQRMQGETAEGIRLLSAHPGTNLGGARDLREIVQDAVRGILIEPSRLLNVKSTLVTSRKMYRFLEKIEGDYPLLKEMGQNLPQSLGLVDKISRTLSSEGEILDTASEELGQIRGDLKIQHGRLRDRMDKMVQSERYAKYLQEKIVTQRDGRYVLPIRADARGKIRGIVHDQSASGATLFLEPQQMVEQNNRYRQLELEEKNEERRILSELTRLIAGQEGALLEVVSILTDLDLILARAKFASGLDAVRPTLHPFPEDMEPGHPGVVLRLFGARHPLLAPEEVVPIDVALDEQTYAMIITGPNTGGKTVTLKTVGLLALMAQTGLHIPAAPGSELSLFQDVFADIGDEQSIEQSLSTFSGHITNIISILENLNRRSLILLDELGAGTDPQEGAALARALLTHLLERGVTALVTTHHPDLKAYAHTTPGVTNASVEFDLDTLQPTYHLTVGLPGRSNALAIASRLGLRDEIIDSARTTLNPADLQADDLLDEIHRQRKLAEEAWEAAEEARRQVVEKRDQLAVRLGEIEEERQQVLAEARKESREEIVSLREKIQEFREQREQEQVAEEEIAEIAQELDRVDEELSRPVEIRETPVPEDEQTGPLLEGSRVYIRSLDQKGEVTSLGERSAEVQVGQIRVRADREDLRVVSSPSPPQKKSSTVRTPRDVESPGLELDLRGQIVEEAVTNLGYYLDKAFLAGLPWVRIIHGKGMGRLRSAVREELEVHPQVENYQRGELNEGGDGVTVVNFRE